MQRLELTLDTPAANLALDDALLETAEREGRPRELLRLWEPLTPFVAVGRASRLAEEVDLAGCRQRDLAIVRRPSGGGAVVVGPGCFVYSLVLSYELRPALRAIDRAHRFILETVLAALRPLIPTARYLGTSDLALQDGAASLERSLKFSGNSLRCRRDHLLYHGTLLYDFPLELIDACLLHPPRQPAYRADRPHSRFVTNLPLTAAQLRAALIAAWNADEPCTAWPRELVDELVATRYGRDDWNARR